MSRQHEQAGEKVAAMRMAGRWLTITVAGAAVAVVALAAYFVLNSAGCQRTVKSISFDFSGGLERRVTLYDYSGNEIDHWEGIIDLSDNSDANKVLFDLNGKRTVINGGIVVTQEL